MGRKTFDSLPKGALPNRRNIVLSRQDGLVCAGAECFTSLEEALAHCNAEEEIFIMGGASVYKEALPLTHRLYITLVHDTGKQADAFFPEIDEKVWKETSRLRRWGNLGLFSATISREVMDISWVYQRDPEEITVQATRENKPDILQYRIEVPSDKKVDAIASIIRAQQLDRVICFCNTKGSTERLTKFLQLRGLDAQCIHGDIPQRKREEVMARFRDGELHVFVATDVASRGIDVDDVDAVFNFEVPEENEYYIHRIGRTGRARKHGVAYTLLSDFPSRMRLDDIARNTRSQIIPAVLGEDGQVTPAENKSK